MRKLRQRFCFAHKPLEKAVRLLLPGQDQLDGYQAAEGRILGLVDDGHAAAPQFTHNLIPRNHLANLRFHHALPYFAGIPQI